MRPSSLAAAALVALLAAACTPTCERTCRKLDKCAADGSTVTQIECEGTCLDLLEEHKERDDEARKEAFAAHRRCLVSATCDEIDDGVCYDEALYAF